MAYKAHFGHYRKHYKIPYISHPLEVYKLLVINGVTNEIVLAAALLHDVLEDTEIDESQILNETNNNVLVIVKKLTKPDGLAKEDYLKNLISDNTEWAIETREIKVCDRICNVKDYLNSNSEWAVKYFDKAKYLFKKYKQEANRIAELPFLEHQINQLRDQYV